MPRCSWMHLEFDFDYIYIYVYIYIYLYTVYTYDAYNHIAHIICIGTYADHCLHTHPSAFV